MLIDVGHELYPPALAALGFDLARTIVVRPRSLAEGTWAFEQALRSPGVAAAWCRNQNWNDRVFRRLQLAVEAGGGLGVASSPLAARRLPSWAAVRWLVRPLPGESGSGLLRSASCPGLPGFSTCHEQPEHDWRRSPGRRLQIELLQARGGTAGGVVDLELCDETGAVCVVSPLAAATAAPRTA